MSNNTANAEPGGFLRSTILPSPPPSTPSVSSNLPTPRSQPLKARSSKEVAFINYVEGKLLEISGRYEKRFNAGNLANGQNEKGNGYESFSEIAKDLENVFDVVWVSGTPNLQIPFLLNLAGAAGSYLASFPLAPQRTFQLLQKLDLAFSSLLTETNVETGDPLPGFQTGRKVTMTEKVRLRGVVERTRLSLARVASKEGTDEESRITDVTEDEDDTMTDDNDDYEGYSHLEMDIARAYERTLVDLGPSLDHEPSIGIPEQDSV